MKVLARSRQCCENERMSKTLSGFSFSLWMSFWCIKTAISHWNFPLQFMFCCEAQPILNSIAFYDRTMEFCIQHNVDNKTAQLIHQNERRNYSTLNWAQLVDGKNLHSSTWRFLLWMRKTFGILKKLYKPCEV